MAKCFSCGTPAVNIPAEVCPTCGQEVPNTGGWKLGCQCGAGVLLEDMTDQIALYDPSPSVVNLLSKLGDFKW